MRKYFNIFIFFLAFQSWAGNTTVIGANDLFRKGHTIAPKLYSYSPKILASGLVFEEVAKKNNILHRRISNVEGILNGYYIIAGVFGNVKNQESAVKTFFNQGFKSGYIYHNNLYYVYIAKNLDWQGVITSVTSQCNGRYMEKIWILHVDSSPSSSPEISKISQGDHLFTILQNDTTKSSNTKKDPINDKLIARANSYFDKMWYAEAAKLYEEALEDNYDEASMALLQRVGDANYYNTNMERAYYWYSLLYERYEKDMTPEALFKYAHATKGNGKYGKAKRLMRLYDRKMGKSNVDEGIEEKVVNPVLNEAVLDNIPTSKAEYSLENLSVNSSYSDFSPAFFGTDQLVFSSSKDSLFLNTRRYKWNNQPYLDLYVGKINEESQDVKDAIKFSKKINTKYHEASVTFSPDNSTMYFTRNNFGKKLKRDKKGNNNLKIYRSIKMNGEWTEAEELSFTSNDYSTGHPALSPDGKKLYFVSDMPGTMGMTDIFVVDVFDDGTFSQPKNLGPEINSVQREMFPFVTEKNIYFSSDGHDGFGGLDVYSSEYTHEDGFTAPINLGIPINSNKDDFSYIVNESSHKGYFASNREGGKGDDDIYAFQRLLPEETPQNAIAGVITALETGETMPKALITLLDENNIKLKEMQSNEDGSFIFEDLDSNTKYILQIVSDGFQTENRIIKTKENVTVNEDIGLRKLHERIIVEEGIRKFKTENILFDFDKFNIRSDAAEELDKLVQVMKENPSMVIKIESHTDSRGTREYNKYLSDRRAKSTRDYIISKGIDANRIESAMGYGEDRLINRCNGNIACTEQQHLLNRRSEFIVLQT